MREILFRGKRVDGKGWASGSLDLMYDLTPFITFWVSELIEPENNYYEMVCKTFEVYPESVGQFIGLLDKNGKKIFEGDVLKLTYDGESFNCEVKFKDGGFLVYQDNAFNGGDSDMTLVGWLKHGDHDFAIIGNIHDSSDNLPPNHNE